MYRFKYTLIVVLVITPLCILIFGAGTIYAENYNCYSAAREKIECAVLNHNDYVDIPNSYNMSMNDISEIISTVQSDGFQYFNLNPNRYCITCDFDSTSIYLSYWYPKSYEQLYYKTIIKKTNAITKVAKKTKGYLKKVGVIFGWVERNMYYDNNYVSTSWSTYSALTKHKAVCVTYSGVFAGICKRVGITQKQVISNDHEWNYVSYNGKWYVIDCSNDGGYVDYKNSFMVSDSYHWYNIPHYLCAGIPVEATTTTYNRHSDWNWYIYGLKVGTRFTTHHTTYKVVGKHKVSVVKMPKTKKVTLKTYVNKNYVNYKVVKIKHGAISKKTKIVKVSSKKYANMVKQAQR